MGTQSICLERCAYEKACFRIICYMRNKNLEKFGLDRK